MSDLKNKINKQYVYLLNEAKWIKKDILWGKWYGLVEMVSLGLTIPDWFIITTETCWIFSENNNSYPKWISEEIYKTLEKLELSTGKKLWDIENPLLVSVRSGSAISMPWMMDTVLNLWLNDETVKWLIKKTWNQKFVLDSYRRFIQMFANVVMWIWHNEFEKELQKIKSEKWVKDDIELEIKDLEKLIKIYKKVVEKNTWTIFPNDTKNQLEMAIEAVLNSWNNERAIIYRKINNIKWLLWTAVVVQEMVFWNMWETSATGVCFTRNPSTWENKLYGEFLVNAQWEDVVAGIRTPKKIQDLEKIMPKAYNQLVKTCNEIEKYCKDMQDIEFTIEENKLFILQTRTWKRTIKSDIRIAVEMVEQWIIDEKTAILRIDPNKLETLLHKQIDPKSKENSTLLAKWLPASPWAAMWKIVLNSKDAKKEKELGKKVILVRTETSPEDIEWMISAEWILTTKWGMTSHAAVVARWMWKCCISGCSEVNIDEKNETILINKIEFKPWDIITLDGSTGEVFKWELNTVEAELSIYFESLMSWADKYKKMQIKTNADTSKDTLKALKFWAEWIGLCRTEHMFFEESRILAFRKMIVSKNNDDRKKALDEIEPFQKQDFIKLFETLDWKPMIIRLVDPPLHEFLPEKEEEIIKLAKEIDIDIKELRKTISELHEVNPMLWFRWARLSIVYPEITKMQVRAIFNAALEVKNSKPWIEIPLIWNEKEYRIVKKIIEEVAEELWTNNYKIGSMIEVPRAALTVEKFVSDCDFLSFGTNDLTQMLCGFSRDDSASFLKDYVEKWIYKNDPFQVIDQEWVWELMKICVEKARKVNPNIHIWICWEHWWDPESIEFCHKLWLDEVSCSPYRVAVARLSAAQAALK